MEGFFCFFVFFFKRLSGLKWQEKLNETFGYANSDPTNKSTLESSVDKVMDLAIQQCSNKILATQDVLLLFCFFFFLIRPASRRWHASVRLNITKHVRHVAHQLQIKTITHLWNPTDTSPGSDISFVKQIVCHRCTHKKNKKTCCACLWHHHSAVTVVEHYAHVCFCVLIGEKSLLMLCM